MRSVKPVLVRASATARIALALGAALTLAGCGAQIDRHGHVFVDVDLASIKPGMTKDQVAAVLGSPDTTSTIGGDANYYISSTQKSVAFLKPWEIDRQVVAVYFTPSQTVQQVANYGLKDGIVVNYYKGETPARGKDLTVIEQLFGNISNRKLFKDQRPSSGIPGGLPRGEPGHDALSFSSCPAHLLVGEHREQQQRHDISDLDHRVDRGARRVLVRIADRIAGDGRLMGV